MRHRVSLVILIPLTLWALFVMIPEVGAFFCRTQNFSADVKQWIKMPSRSLLLILWMVGERRRDVLHGPYVTKPRMARGNIHAGKLEGANAVDELARIVRDIEGESEMSTARLQELEEMAAKLLATARCRDRA